MLFRSVASFGHVNGVHLQNVDTWEAYASALGEGRLPLRRAYKPTPEERLIRELVLQLKRGAIAPSYFAGKYGVDILQRFAEPFAALQASGDIDLLSADRVRVSRSGLLHIDSLLPRFLAKDRHLRRPDPKTAGGVQPVGSEGQKINGYVVNENWKLGIEEEAVVTDPGHRAHRKNRIE